MGIMAGRFFLLLAVCCLAAPPTAGSDLDAPTKEESHRKMLRDLDRVAAETLRTNPYLGTAELERQRRRLRTLPDSAPAPERFDILLRLGVAELEQGLEREAIAHFEEAIRLVNRDAGRSRFTSEKVITTIQFLAVACLRLAETENCCARPHPENCIVPLSPAAQHERTEGSRKAIRYLTDLLESIPLNEYEQHQAMWLLNIAYMTLGEHPHGVPEKWRVILRAPDDEARGEEFPAFDNIAAEAGVDTFSLAGGAIADDFDGDGDIDLVVSSWDAAVSMTFLSNDGDGSFTRREDAGLEGIRGGLNLRQADYDDDGDLDILALRGAWLGPHGRHPNSLLENDGSGRFTDVTHAVGLAAPAFPTQTAAWADYDLDGDLDLFIGNESSGEIDAPCQLYRNEGQRFVDVAAEAGVDARAYVKGVTWGDYDGDRYPDLFLSCIGGPNRLFHNLGNGAFEDASELLGETAGPIRSFPTWFFDYDNDGWLDLFASTYRGAGLEYVSYYRGLDLPDESIAALFRNEGGEGFRNVTRTADLDRPMVPMGSNFGDLTNNGYPDIYLGTGTPDYHAIFPNMLFVNEGDRFRDATFPSRMGNLQKGHAVAFADFDRDGDLDVFEQMGGALSGDGYFDTLFENPGFDRHWLGVRLRGDRSNHYGVGSRVAVLVDDPERGERWIYQWMNSGGSFGGNPLELHFGLSDASRVRRVEVFWPVTGETQVLSDLEADQVVVIHEE